MDFNESAENRLKFCTRIFKSKRKTPFVPLISENRSENGQTFSLIFLFSMTKTPEKFKRVIYRARVIQLQKGEKIKSRRAGVELEGNGGDEEEEKK